MTRIRTLKTILWIIVGIMGAVGITRFLFGLGVTTNLSDNTPWGFWIGFDVMGGVALAGGGFVIAAFNYIFKREEFHPISRAAILTAFLGYIAVAVGLLFDLGLPWNIWHMIIFWNPHSPLFEVGWCVMLYLTVLTMEFAPVVLEKYPNFPFLRRIYKFLVKIRIPLVILGIMLSTLHQSSLGSLFLAMPYKLHPLWYTPILPIMFFVSAICLGLMMVMFESMASHWLYHEQPKRDIAAKLSKIAIFMLLFYAVLRFGDILVRGAGVFMLENTWPAFLFWTEMIISIGIPLLIFIIPAARKSVGWMFAGATLGVVGVVFNRLNVGGLTHLNNIGEVGLFYFPSWMEFAVSAGVVSLAALAFFYFVENFKVWEHPPKDPRDDVKKKPSFSSHQVYLGPSKAADRTRFSFAFVVAFAIAFAFISGERIYGEGYEIVPVREARGNIDTLLIDGNRDGYSVRFKHTFHSDIYECQRCHHMNLPDAENSSCMKCHYNMYTEGDAFKHDWHASSKGAGLECFECHAEGMHKNKESAFAKFEDGNPCLKCHDDVFPANPPFMPEQFKTVAYVDAMHIMCIDCHRDALEQDSALKARNPKIALCQNCHPDVEPQKEPQLFTKSKRNKWVVIPGKVELKK